MKNEKQHNPARDLVITIKGMKNEYKIFRVSRPVVFIGAMFIVFFGLVAFIQHGQSRYLDALDKQELLTYRSQYAAQEEKLQMLLAENEKIQKDLADITALETEVRNKLGEDSTVSRGGVERTSQTPDFKGKGGPGRPGLSTMDVVASQNKLLEIQIARKAENLNSLLIEMEQKSVMPNLWPVDSWEITSRFGYRYDPFGNGTEFHEGIDIAGSYGEPVYAAAAGDIETAGWNGGYGRYVKIRHGGGYETAYGHMSGIAVSAGAQVKKGDVIGYVGSSGYSTGSHLHFEVIRNGAKVDPLKVLNY